MTAASTRRIGNEKYALALFLAIAACVPALGQPPQNQSAERDFPKLKFRKWSGDINVPDPVSVSVDDQGRVYASQTKRRKIQDLDIREHTEWIPDDVALMSVEEKRTFLKTKLAIGGDQTVQRKHVQDLNGDGQHDWRDLQVVSEVIYQLNDVDDDGTADEISVFAENFNTEVTGIAAGVLAYDGSVWATVAPDVWKLTDTNNDGQADEREVMAHGFGLHIAYAGHDMHGLTVGPDGKIYWSIGDKGINVTTADGKQHLYPNQGGVLRCNPDGSDFEVFAHGLRNVQELAFDKFGNLFSVDNDSDQPNEKERFVYIVNGMDAGWRCNYQYRGSLYNPWVDEKLWELPGDHHPAYIVPPLSHYVDGPAGFVYNPGTALSPEYYDFFFLTSAPNGQQYAFRAEPQGDAFRMVDAHQIGSGIAIVGWNWGPDGALYGADWDGGYPLDQKGSVIRIDSPGVQQAIRDEVKQLLKAGFRHRKDEELGALLGHQDQRVRLYSQFELATRNQHSLLESIAVATDQDPVTRVHAVWGLGQLSRAGNEHAALVIASLCKDEDSNVRGQAAKTFGELRKVDGELLIPLLSDENEHVRSLAAIALARQPTSAAVPILLSQASQLDTDQHYLRHALAWALSHCATSEQLAASENLSANVMQRLTCTVALRQQRSSLVATYLDDPSDWVATEAARAIHDDFSIREALEPLADSLNSRTDQTEAFARRAINANFREGTRESAVRVVTFAADETRPLQMRLEALDALSDWNNPQPLDRVDGRNRHLSPRKLEVAAIANVVARLLETDDARIRTAALQTAHKHGIPLSDSMLVRIVQDKKLDEMLRTTALKTLASRSASDQLVKVCEEALRSQSLPLRKQAIQSLCQVNPAIGIESAIRIIDDESMPVSLQQIAIRSLENLPGSDSLLKRLLVDFEKKELSSSLALDLMETISADKRVDLPTEVDLRTLARDGGDIAKGEALFRTHQQAQCSRCHRVGRSGSDIGPELSKVGAKRDADYILRAIVNPSADIEDKYRTQMFLLDSGQLLKGVLISESDTETKIADAEGKEVTIQNDEIIESKVQTVSLMPEMHEVLTPSQVRDLMAYLRSLGKP